MAHRSVDVHRSHDPWRAAAAWQLSLGLAAARGRSVARLHRHRIPTTTGGLVRARLQPIPIAVAVLSQCSGVNRDGFITGGGQTPELGNRGAWSWTGIRGRGHARLAVAPQRLHAANWSRGDPIVV